MNQAIHLQTQQAYVATGTSVQYSAPRVNLIEPPDKDELHLRQWQ